MFNVSLSCSKYSERTNVGLLASAHDKDGGVSMVELPFKRRKIARKFFYTCPECATMLARVKPLRQKTACIKCCRKHNGGQYHARFRFRPVERPDKIAA